MDSGSLKNVMSTPNRPSPSIHTPTVMTPGTESTIEKIQRWTASNQLHLLREMINDEEIRNKITGLLCASKNTKKVFFAANTGKGNISTEKEIEALLDTINYTMDSSTLLVPNTTKKQVESVLHEKKPQIIVFSGHGALPQMENFYFVDEQTRKEVLLEHSSLILFDEEHGTGKQNKTDTLLFSDLIKIILEAYKNIAAPALMVFSACHTGGIIKQLKIDEHCKEFFKDTIVIGWETLVEDSAAINLSIPLIKNIFNPDFTPIQVEDIYIEYYKVNELKIGDPDVDLKNIALHKKIFLEDIDTYLQTNGQERTSWRIKAPEFTKKYPSCKHCNPSFTGIPYLYMKGEYINYKKKKSKRLEYMESKNEGKNDYENKYEDEDGSKKARIGEPMDSQ